MQFNLHLAGRAKLFLAGIGVLVLLLALFAAARSMVRREPTPEELRLQHLEYLVRFLEGYRQQNGAYPQPTARRETREGIRHVWGYEPDRPSLASCTIASDAGGNTDPDASRCGGGVYDVQGNLIGWKGTLTSESGLNNVEAARRGGGRIAAPISDTAPELPVDPTYAALPDLTVSGFGEYVYAVRVPADSAENKGGSEYQIAVTTTDPETGVRRTHIRGNYFVKSDERDILPTSLIGPGILFDEFNNPREGQSRPLHVLVDTQREGYPNPVLGDGDEALKLLMLRRRAERLLQATRERAEILGGLPPSDAVARLIQKLEGIRVSAEFVIWDISSPPDLELLEVQLPALASDLKQATTAFLADKGEEVRGVLRQEIDGRDAAVDILEGALQAAEDAEEALLFARDEILKYLDGKGIEEQTRSRVGRKLEEVSGKVPDLVALFAAEGLALPRPFLPDDLREAMRGLAEREGTEGAAVNRGDGEEPAVRVSTLAAELVLLFDELKLLLTQTQEALRNASTPLEDVDESLRKLTRALGKERERIGRLFVELTDRSAAERLLSLFETLNGTGAQAPAIARVAELSMQQGDFSPLLFDPALLDRVMLEESPGIPDIDAHEHALEAEYRGIPYPLP